MLIPFFNTYLNPRKNSTVLAVVLFFILSSQFSFAQTITEDTLSEGNASSSDSVVVVEKKKGLSSPKRAMLLSMACPGLGQAYNKKYWKLPILYAGVSLLAYFWITNQQGYSEMKGAVDAYNNSYDPTTPTSIPVFEPFIGRSDGFRYTSISQVKIARDDYRSNRDLSIVLSVTLYAVQILDAYVDAHLKEFDVSKDLSLKITPLIYQNNNANFTNYSFTTGVNLCFTLK